MFQICFYISFEFTKNQSQYIFDKLDTVPRMIMNLTNMKNMRNDMRKMF